MIRAAKIRAYIKLIEQRGIAPRRLFAGTEVSAQEALEPGYCITPEQHHAIVMNLIRLTKEPGIAFEAGDAFEFGDLGILGYALLSSRTMRDAWDIWVHYSYPLVGSPLRLVLTEQDRQQWSLVILSLAPQPELQRFYIEEFLVTGVKLFGLLASQIPTVQSLSFSFSEPPHRALYDQWFRRASEFGAPETLIRFGLPGLDVPLRTNNEELHRLCAEHCRQILQHLPKNNGMEPRLRSLFLASSSRLPDSALACGHLGVSQRTLRRRLAQRGSSYRQLKHEFRLDLAREYLASGHLSLKEISYLLGYASPSAFCRAYKSWTGLTPGQSSDAGQ